jgi:hypothetical protein
MSSQPEPLSAPTANPTNNFANMETQTLAGLLHTMQTVAIAALVFAVCAYFPKLRRQSQLGKLPSLSGLETGEKQRQAYLASAKNIYEDGYAKVSEFNSQDFNH